MPRINAHFLPELTSPAELSDSAVVVIDVLRATTTIAEALANGARRVIPCLEVDEARRRAAELPVGEVLLGGERDGQRIDGFDLGNSPCEYTRDAVAGRTIVFTTTNGTKALESCRKARRVLLGAFVNRTAVAAALDDEDVIELLCAGTNGQITREDVLFAGALAAQCIDRRCDRDEERPWLNDEAQLAFDAWRALWFDVAKPLDRTHEQELIAEALTDSWGGRNLVRLSLEDDVLHAADLDRLPIVPEWNPAEGTIR